jgi:hypothetical protein
LLKRFRKFINENVAKNEKKFIVKKNLKVDAKPEFINLFKETNMIASTYR